MKSKLNFELRAKLVFKVQKLPPRQLLQKNIKNFCKMKNKINEISPANYQKILGQIQKQIAQTQKNIVKNVTRQKVEMAWQIGKIIDQDLAQKDEKTYGQNLISKLEQDIGIGESVLYRMRNFYATYPEMPRDEDHLNWTHYRILSGIKKADQRKYLENLVKKNAWDSDELQEEVAKTKIAQIRENKSLKAANKKTKISPTRGKLFFYKIKKITGSKKYFLDCGFGIFREITETLPRSLQVDGQIVSSIKSGEKYSLKKATIPPQQLHTYKAHLEKLVDGDTIRINLDLGFGIFHHEILRLAKIAAPEMSTESGKKSAQALEKILKDVPFLVIKSNKTDVYGRYVADVFLAPLKPKNLEAQVVADEGVYLNQLLLYQGFAEIFQGSN